MQLSSALAATQTALLASQFNGGFVRLFSGTPPTSPDQAETGTLLGIVSVNAVAEAGLHFTSAGAVLQKADETWAFKGLVDGTAGWFRLVQPGDTGAADLDALRLDGSIGTPTAPGDMNWTDLAVVAGAIYTLDTFLYLISPVGTSP